MKYRFNLDEDKAQEEALISAIEKNTEFKGTKLWTLIFAILPLLLVMGPIMGIGLGVDIFNFEPAIRLTTAYRSAYFHIKRFMD